MKKSLAFTDRQLALLANALQFVALSLGVHPDAQDANRIPTMLLGLEALEQTPPEVMSATLAQVLTAAKEITDPELYTMDKHGNVECGTNEAGPYVHRHPMPEDGDVFEDIRRRSREQFRRN